MGALSAPTEARGPRRGARAASWRVGLIADTHGLLRPEAKAFLTGSDHILHAGDIGDQSIVRDLRAIAPTSLVRGNNDTAPWAYELPESLELSFGELKLCLIHDRAALPAPGQAHIVITGHSHKPTLKETDGCLYINPGSAGPRRFKLPVALGDLRIEGRQAEARIVDLASRNPLASLTIRFA